MGTGEQEVKVATGRPRWTRLATLGLVMVAAGPLSMLLAGLSYGLDMSEQTSFLLPVIAIPLVAALLVWFLPWWSRIIGILAAAAAGFGMFWTAFGLAQPGNAFDFIPGVLVMPGALIAIVACIASIVAHRRNSLSESAVGGERTAIRIVLAVVAVAAIVSGGLTFAGKETASGTSADATIATKDFKFSPKELKVAGGSTILVRNSDPFFHTFTIEELDIDIKLTAGDEVEVALPATTGTYRFYCIPHSSGADPSEKSETDDLEEEEGDDEEMAGTLTIG
ncbi:MAG TPA: cupredoxin domain-containing protein [Actinomycetota bacterium]|nr:cupredoxin domain-containing protein [Actinomycetota bacterium]